MLYSSLRNVFNSKANNRLQSSKLLLLRSFSGERELKRALSHPRTSGSWPDEIVTSSSSAAQTEKPATDYDLNQYLKGILQAQSVIYEACGETALDYAPTISALTGNDVFLKREDQQPVFSFKIRGAFNKISSLSDEKKNVGIIACSAGNHAVRASLSYMRFSA